MTATLFDTHVHLDAPEFDPDRAAVLARARAAGVARQLIPAVDAAGWDALQALCDTESGLLAALGLHPMYLDRHRPEHLRELAQRLQRRRPAALGECGLDFHVKGLDQDAQRHYFHAQLALARDFDLPLVLHARGALDEVILALRRTGGLRGVVHSFSGSAEQAAQLWRLGFHLGIGGPITYERARRLRSIVQAMPIEWLLLETDAPDQPLATHRGERNEPCRLSEVAAAVAQLRDCSVEQIVGATTANAMRLFAPADTTVE